jgi:hypothetical protein
MQLRTRGRGRRAPDSATFSREVRNMPDVVFPVTCPTCNEESLSSLPAATIERTLLTGEPLLLRSACHKIQWPATGSEIEQIKGYLWVAQLG